jgi:hypothetical protein
MVSLSSYAGLLGMSPADLAARYRQRAGKCFTISQKMEDAGERLELIDMAQAWLALAEQAERNGQLFTVHETPEQRPRVAQQQQQIQPKSAGSKPGDEPKSE